MRHLKTLDLVTIALVAAILCILSPISIPLGFTPIPMTLGVFAMVLSGILLGSVKGTLCVLIYILIGAAGIPVFSGYGAGLSKIAGPSGGYLWGYLFLAAITGFFVEKFAAKWYMVLLGAILGMMVCYAFGTIWMALQLSMGPMEALWAGVVPFLPLDVAKIVLAVLVGCPVRAALVAQNLISVKSVHKNQK